MVDTMGDSFELTGHPGDLFCDARVSVGTVLDALDQLSPSWDEFTMVRVLDPLSPDPVISVERDERVTRVDMSAIRARLTTGRPGRATVRNTGQVRNALHAWVNTLPVSDREAAAHGIRVVTWADSLCQTLALDVIVPREKTLIPWVPSMILGPAGAQTVQENATVNAAEQGINVERIQDGAALIWRHIDPRLSSVIFADLDLVRAYLGTDLVCVYTPGFPVVAAPPTAALRLAEETMSDNQLLTFSQAGALNWKAHR